MKNLLLITGAGASRGVVDPGKAKVNMAFYPPLARDLFNPKYVIGLESFIQVCLNGHPLAAQIGYRFQLMPRDEQELGMEKYLAELKNNRLLMKRNQYWATLLFLKQLFEGISSNYISSGLPSNYKELIDGIAESQYDQILWLNLNYDLLADSAIKVSAHSELHSLEDYTNLQTPDGLKIIYTKPHGSVDWYRQISDPTLKLEKIKRGELPKNFEMELLTKTVFTEREAVFKRREEHVGNAHYFVQFPEGWFPALTAPIGKYDYIIENHIEIIKKELKTTTDLLSIGFNALDNDILDLIRDHAPEIKKMLLVNGNRNSNISVCERITEHCKNVRVEKNEAVFDGDFTYFIMNGMKSWLSK